MRRATNRPRLGPLAAALAALCVVGAPVLAPAQLPPDAVDLAKVKIPRTLESTDLCPVHLVPSAADGETWSHDGVDYRASEAGSRETFLADPAKYVDQHERELWVLNFMNAMSTIWCPITDEVTPGGRKRVDGHGYTWESCCSFCDEEMSPENFTDALETLRERAEESYELTGGAYVEGATSPVEGAIKDSF